MKKEIKAGIGIGAIAALMSIAVLLFLLPSANANINSCTLNIPAANQYDNGLIKLNATAIWDNATNLTAVNFTLIGTSTFTFANNTINGTSTNSSAGATAIKGDFTFTINTSNVPSDDSYSVVARCRNNTSPLANNSELNATARTYVIDTRKPSIQLNEPYQGSTVVPNNDFVTFKYTPSEANLGNCSLHVNNVNVKSTTSVTTSSNVTNGQPNSLLNRFGADNTSVRAVIECVDLAGLVGDSNNITFNVMQGYIAPAIKLLQAQEAGGAAASLPSGSSNSGNLLGGLKNVDANINSAAVNSHLQAYGWMYVAGILGIGLIYYYRKKLFK